MRKAEEQAWKNHTFIGLGPYEIERLKEEFLAGYRQAEKDLMADAIEATIDGKVVKVIVIDE